MVTMVPANPKESTNFSENAVFRALEGITDRPDWVVLHSIEVFQNIFTLESEVDFVVLVPGQGIVVIEVKNPDSVTYADGEWTLEGVPRKHKDPLHQLSRARSNLKAYLDRHDIPTTMPIARLLWFTGINRHQISIDRPQDISFFEWEMGLENDLHNPAKFIEHILESHVRSYGEAEDLHFEPASFDKERVAQIRNTIWTNFTTKFTKTDRRNERKVRSRRLLEQQVALLDLIETNRHIYFEGSAGTGKTALIQEAARRKAKQGKRTLITCWNYMLAEELSLLDAGRPNLTIRDLNNLMLEIVGRTGNPKNASSDWFQVELPKLAIEELKAHPGRYQFDAICVDEFQDIAHMDDILEFLFRLGNPTLENTEVVLAGDKVQAIMGGSLSRDPLTVVRALFPDTVHARLRINCRNTPSLANNLANLLNLKGVDFQSFRERDVEEGGLEIRHIRGADQAKELEKAINQLRENYLDEDIRILSPFGENRSLLGRLFKSESMSQSERNLKKLCKHQSSNGKIRWRSISKFKGLESDAVIIADINQEAVDALAARGQRLEDLLYVGITRAKYKCIVLVSDKVAFRGFS